jgi:hypothetical protein
LLIKKLASAVKTGVRHTKSATVDEAEVSSTAVFSAKKYNEPPESPQRRNLSSSFQLFEIKCLCAKGSIKKYASKKRNVIIPAGESPLLSKTLLTANVEPQISDVINAKEWKSILRDILF